MRRPLRSAVIVTVFACAAAGTAALVGSQASPAPANSKYVELLCKNGWRGSIGGVYGGVPFGLDCNYDRISLVITGVSGSAYSARMGVESFEHGAVDCFFTGDSEHVHESCADVRLTIR